MFVPRALFHRKAHCKHHCTSVTRTLLIRSFHTCHHNLSRIPACEDSGMRAMTASTRALFRLRSPAECPSSTARDSDWSDIFTKLSLSSSSATRSFAASVASFACASSAPARARSAAVSASICLYASIRSRTSPWMTVEMKSCCASKISSRLGGGRPVARRWREEVVGRSALRTASAPAWRLSQAIRQEAAPAADPSLPAPSLASRRRSPTARRGVPRALRPSAHVPILSPLRSRL